MKLASANLSKCQIYRLESWKLIAEMIMYGWQDRHDFWSVNITVKRTNI